MGEGGDNGDARIMKRKLSLLAILAVLAIGSKRVQPTLETSCTVCDSAKEVVDWGDGTYRSVIYVRGAGYDASKLVRVTWSDGQDEWSFDCPPHDDGTFSEVWVDVPEGQWTITSSQAHNKNKQDALASVSVTVL